MTPIIKKAQKGNKEAFITLYNSNKQRVLYLCNLLLCDISAAESACVHVFKSAWQFILDGEIESEHEFKEFVIKKAANHCKNKISKADAKAFKMPQNKNFVISSYSFESCSSDDIFDLALEVLPTMHRFIYVLDTYAEWGADDIAEFLHTKADTVNLAFDCRKNNFDRFSYALRQEKGINMSFGEDEFKDYISEGEAECKVNSSVDSAVISSVGSVITPIIKNKKKKRLKIGLIVGIPLIIAILVALLIVNACLSNKGNTVGSGATEETYDEEEYYDDFYDLEWITQIEEPTQYAVIDVKGYGKITVALDANSAPETVENFVSLAKSGFYDGLTFHRIIEGFMMQGGDPNADGTGGNTDENGNEINVTGEFYYNGYDNYLSHTRGAISMARADDYNSASSQFFIVQEDCSADLDGSYAVFGYVVEGMDIVDAVCAEAEPTDDNGTIEKADQPVITSIKIYTPEEYAALGEDFDSDVTGETDDSTADESVTPIDAKIAEVSAISTRDQSLFLTLYGLNEESVDYEITDVAKVDLSKYEVTEKIEKYEVDPTAKVYEIKDGELVEFDSANIAEGDMMVIYTDAEDIVNVIVYHSENLEKEESTEETV